MTADGGALVRRVGWSGLAQILPQLTQLVLTPYFIHVLGLDGFGLWSLVLVFVATLTALDGGICASLARFFAVHTANDDPAAAGRLLLTATAVFVLLSVVVSGLAVGLAPLVAGWLRSGSGPAWPGHRGTAVARAVGGSRPAGRHHWGCSLAGILNRDGHRLRPGLRELQVTEEVAKSRNGVQPMGTCSENDFRAGVDNALDQPQRSWPPASTSAAPTPASGSKDSILPMQYSWSDGVRTPRLCWPPRTSFA